MNRHFNQNFNSNFAPQVLVGVWIISIYWDYLYNNLRCSLVCSYNHNFRIISHNLYQGLWKNWSLGVGVQHIIWKFINVLERPKRTGEKLHFALPPPNPSLITSKLHHDLFVFLLQFPTKPKCSYFTPQAFACLGLPMEPKGHSFPRIRSLRNKFSINNYICVQVLKFWIC